MRTGAIAATILLLSLTGCSSSSGAGTPVDPAEPDRECLDVPADVQQTIAEGANETTITPVDAAAVTSLEEDGIYVVAMSFTAPGVEDPEVGVWMTHGLDLVSAGPIYAVDGFAHEFTVWPHTVNDHELSVNEDGVDEAKACLEAR